MLALGEFGELALAELARFELAREVQFDTSGELHAQGHSTAAWSGGRRFGAILTGTAHCGCSWAGQTVRHAVARAQGQATVRARNFSVQQTVWSAQASAQAGFAGGWKPPSALWQAQGGTQVTFYGLFEPGVEIVCEAQAQFLPGPVQQGVWQAAGGARTALVAQALANAAMQVQGHSPAQWRANRAQTALWAAPGRALTEWAVQWAQTGTLRAQSQTMWQMRAQRVLPTTLRAVHQTQAQWVSAPRQVQTGVALAAAQAHTIWKGAMRVDAQWSASGRATARWRGQRVRDATLAVQATAAVQMLQGSAVVRTLAHAHDAIERPWEDRTVQWR